MFVDKLLPQLILMWCNDRTKNYYTEMTHCVLYHLYQLYINFPLIEHPQFTA